MPLSETVQSPKLAARLAALQSPTAEAAVASIGEGADPSFSYLLTKYAGMIARAEANTLPQTGRVVLPAGCLGGTDGKPAVCDDPNVGVRGAANILRYVTNNDALRESAANELRAMAAHFAGVKSGAVRRQPSVDTQPLTPKPYTGNAAKARAALRSLPGYVEPDRRAKQKDTAPESAQEVGLF